MCSLGRSCIAALPAAGFRRIELEWPSDVEGKQIDVCVTALGATYIATYDALFRADDTRLVKVMRR